MNGAFLTSRELFDNPIWKNILEFRLFFLIYGNAVYAEEGYRVTEDLLLQRGQWLRSTRKLQEDLEFIENRQLKKYSTSSLHRAILSLVKAQRLCTKTHELGTVFTVLNYEQYQGFGHYKKDNLERNLEQSENSDRTVGEQWENNNKKDIKDIKEININSSNHSYTNVFGMYQREIGSLSEIIRDTLIDLELTYSEEWVKQAIKIAVKAEVKKLTYIEGVLRGWAKLNHPEPWTVEKQVNTSNPKVHHLPYQRQTRVKPQIITEQAPSTPLTPEELEEMRQLVQKLDGKADAG